MHALTVLVTSIIRFMIDPLQVMKDYQLYLVIIALVAIDVIIMTTWQIADPFERQTKELEPYVSSN